MSSPRIVFVEKNLAASDSRFVLVQTQRSDQETRVTVHFKLNVEKALTALIFWFRASCQHHIRTFRYVIICTREFVFSHGNYRWLSAWKSRCDFPRPSSDTVWRRIRLFEHNGEVVLFAPTVRRPSVFFYRHPKANKFRFARTAPYPEPPVVCRGVVFSAALGGPWTDGDKKKTTSSRPGPPTGDARGHCRWVDVYDLNVGP